MAADRFKVLITDYAWPTIDVERSILEPIADLVCAPDGDGATLTALARDADAVMFNWATVPPAAVRAAERCLVMSRYGVGLDNLPVDLATELGILVTNIPDYCMDEVSDHALALLFALNRRLLPFDALTRHGRGGEVDLGTPVLRLRGRTLGVIGFGRIGRVMAEKAAALGMALLIHDRSASDSEVARVGGRRVPLERLLAEADAVSLHLPLTPDTHRLIGERELRSMKPTAFLINVARGGVIDTEALVRALDQGWIAGAGLDVLDQEPVPTDHPLSRFDNVVLTPHVAFFSQQSLEELASRCARQVRDVLEGRRPENIRNPDVLDHTRATLEGG